MTKNNKKLAILLVEISLLGLFTMGMYSFNKKELSLVEVYVYKNKITKNSEIEASDFRTKMIPAKAIDSNFLSKKDMEKIKEGGIVAATDVDPGQYAYTSQIKSGDKVDPFETMDLSTYRKITIPVTYDSSIGGEIKRGDLVDLVFSGKVEDSNAKEGGYAKVFMQEVLVYSVTTGEGFEYVDHSHLKKSQTTTGEAEGEDAAVLTDDLTAPAYVTLAVEMNQAEQILSRLEMGNIKILGRFEESVNGTSSGYIHGVSSPNGILYSGEKNIETK